MGWTGNAQAGDEVFDPCLEVDGNGNSDPTVAPRTKELPTNIVFDNTPSTSATTPVADPGNTGNGTISSVATTDTATRTEDWTLTYVAATSDWTVAGTKSGTQTNRASGGVAYSSNYDEVAFTITDGGVGWADGDKFTFSTSHTYNDYREKLAAPEKIAADAGAHGISYCLAQPTTKKRYTPE